MSQPIPGGGGWSTTDLNHTLYQEMQMFNLIEIFRQKWKQYQKQTHFREKNEKIENLLTFVRSTNVIKRNF